MRHSRVSTVSLLFALVFAVDLTTASAQTAPSGTSQFPLTEPLEKYEMPPAAKAGRACNRTERQAAGTSSGSPLIGRMARVMVSSTRRGAPLQLAVAVYSTDQPMPASPGRIRSVFPTPRIGEHSTLRPMG